MEAAGENRDLSVKVLRPKTRALISNLLNPKMFIPAPNGVPRYWLGLASLCKIDSMYEASLMQKPDATSEVLSLWCEKDPDHSTISQLLTYLEEMDRFDVIEDLVGLIDEDIKIYRVNPNPSALKPISLEADRYIITTDDVQRISEGLALENYDAFLLFDQDDIDFAIKVLETMENEHNMRFCVKDRDLVGGGVEMDKMITLITERCNRVVVILSDSFFKSSVNDYYVKFAHAYGLEKERKMIPIRYKDLTIPPHIKYLFTLNYRQGPMFNFWEKLRDSIRVPDPEKLKITRSKSDNGHAVRSALHENRDTCRLKPLNHSVKFSSVGDLKSLETIEEPLPLNPSTSADDLISSNQKKEKKLSLFKKIKTHFRKDKTDCSRQEKSKEFRKNIKRAAAVAN